MIICDIVFKGSNSCLPLNPEGIGLEYVPRTDNTLPIGQSLPVQRLKERGNDTCWKLEKKVKFVILQQCLTCTTPNI